PVSVLGRDRDAGGLVEPKAAGRDLERAEDRGERCRHGDRGPASADDGARRPPGDDRFPSGQLVPEQLSAHPTASAPETPRPLRCWRKTYRPAPVATRYAVTTSGAAPSGSARIPSGLTRNTTATSASGSRREPAAAGSPASSTTPQLRYQGHAAG